MSNPNYVCPFSAGGTIRTCTTVRETSKAKATVALNMDGANADMVATAPDYGYGGNGATITHLDPAANDQALAVTVSGSDVTVSLATGVAGAITSTATEVAAAVAANAEAAALMVLTNADGHDGSGVVNALAEQTLAGGVWTGCPYFDIIASHCTLAHRTTGSHGLDEA